MKYLIVSLATDSDGIDTYLFNGTEEEMQNKVKAKCLDFCDSVKEFDDEYEFSCGYDTYAYPVYQALAQFHDYHFLVQAFKWENVNKKFSVSKKNLYKAKRIEETDCFVKEYENENE